MKKPLRILMVACLLMAILSFFQFAYFALIGKKLFAILIFLQGDFLIALAAEYEMEYKGKGENFFQIEEDDEDYTDEEYLYFYGKPRQ